ncbi:YecA family protein [Cnuibacter sp. UC19_7]|uniref:YecA family protein n=1 Tax=Cnuibacter sp. UC19_7 TaxID=3350166 RepID=UPI00366F7E9B
MEFVVQVSDRRLTALNGNVGSVVTDEETKAIHVNLDKRQLVVGYTGIAAIGNRSTNTVLLDMFMDVAQRVSPEDHDGFVHSVAQELTGVFQTWPGKRLTPAQRRLTVMITGYIVIGDHYQLVQALISNFQVWGSHDEPEAWTSFAPYFIRPKSDVPPEEVTLIQRIGAYEALDPALMETALRPLLAPGKPPSAIRDKLLDLLPIQASAFTTVGMQANAVILRKPFMGVEWSYHTAVNSAATYVGDSINEIEPGVFLATRGMEVRSVDGPPIAVPKVDARLTCPCGSGKLYGKCHGATL